MQRHKILVHSLLAGFALLSLSQAPKAGAETVWVQRGSHGAIQVVDRDRIPSGATPLNIAGSQGFPNLINRGPHGAVNLNNHEQKMKKNMSETQTTQPKGYMMEQSQESPMPKAQSSRRRSAAELLEITNPLI
jgi:Spy/CpxP family protein refolding chaperone